MVDSKMTSTNRILNNIRRIMEIIIQCVIFLELAEIVVLGITQRPDRDFWMAFLIIPLVIVAYFSRHNIKNMFIFSVINFAPAVFAGFYGKNDLENVFFFLCFIVVGAYSMTLKLAMIRKGEVYSYAPEDKNLEQDSSDEHKMALMAGERVNVAFGILMVIGYIIGNNTKSHLLMMFSVVLFVSYVLMQVAYNQVRELDDLFRSNAGKSDFPTNRIININAIIVLAISVMMIIAMIMFYNGRYGNIFTIIGGILVGIVRLFLKLMLIIMKSPEEEIPERPQNKPQVNNDEEGGFNLGDEAVEDNSLMNALFLAFGIMLFIAMIAGFVYIIYKYANRFKNSRNDDLDEVEYIKDDHKNEKKAQRIMEKKIAKELPVNSQYRKLYKKYALSNKLKRPEEAMTPSQITSEFIVKDEAVANKITESYERARYSNKDISKEELDYLKKLT